MCRSICVLIVCTFISAKCIAGESVPDIGNELMRARQAWEEGNALGDKARVVVGDKDYLSLLDQQDAAYERAQNTFRQALKKDPQSPHALSEFGRFWLALNDYGRARSLLEAALMGPRSKAAFAESEAADIFRILGGLLERAGEPNLALGHYQKAFQVNPSDLRNRISLATGLCAAARPYDAVELLQPWADEIIKAQGDGPADTKEIPGVAIEMRALGIYTLALSLEQSGDFQRALDVYQKMESLVGHNIDRNDLTEFTRMAVVRLQEVLAVHRRRDHENTLKNSTVAGSGAALIKTQTAPLDWHAKYIKAFESFKEGVRLKNLALGDVSFQQALAQARETSGVAGVVDGVLEKNSAFESFRGAMRKFDDARAQYPRSALAHYELAVCHFLLGRFENTKPLLDAAIIYDPYNLAILSLQGEVLLALRQPEEAVDVFKNILKLEPDSGRANFGLARAYAVLERDPRECQMALNALDRAERLGLRDARLRPSKILMDKNGRQWEGRCIEEGDAYVMQNGSTQPVRIAKSDVSSIQEKDGLREALLAALQHFEKGDKNIPSPNATQKTMSNPAATKPRDVLNPWSGTIFGN